MTLVLVAWLALVAFATASVISRDRQAAWWIDELATLEVEAHARAIPVALAGLDQQRQPLGNGAQQIQDGIDFRSTGFVVVAPDGPMTIAPGRDVTLIASTALIEDGTVTLPAGTELLLYRRVREPRRPPVHHMRFRIALVTAERGTVLADRGVQLFRYTVPGGRLSKLRLALVAAAGVHAGLHATQLAWALVIAAWLAALAYDTMQDFAGSWWLVRRERDPRVWPDALARARERRDG